MNLQFDLLSEAATPVEDLYVSGLAHIEPTSDGMYRLYFFTERVSTYGGGKDYVICCRMIAGPSAMLAGAKLVLVTLGIMCVCTMKRFLH